MKIEVNISNRVLYTFLSLVSLVLVAVLVQAYGTSNPSNFGHTLSEVASPAGCASNQVLLWNGSSWVCTSSLSNFNITNLNVTNLNGLTINTTNLNVTRLNVTTLTVTNLNVTNTTNMYTTSASSANWSSIVGDPATKFQLISCSKEDDNSFSESCPNWGCSSGWTLMSTSETRTSGFITVTMGLCVKN